MGVSRAGAESELHDQIERTLHRTAAITALVEAPTVTIDASARMLLRLIASHGPVRSSELAEYSRLSRPSVSRYLAALEAAGLVTTQRDPGDGRAALVTLTAAGQSRLERIKGAGVSALSQVTEDFTVVELHTLATLLARLNDNLERRKTDTPKYAENGARS